MEAETPLKVGSNAMDFVKDAPVQKDWNGLPMILGTSIAGVLRKSFEGNKDEVFGNETGSKIIFSNALLVGDNGKVAEELLLDKSTNKIFSLFEDLPIREHTAINDKGVTSKGAKFDEEVVYKGSRFKFSIEFIEEQKDIFELILNQLSNPAFRLGGGTTKGFGKFKVHEIKTALLGLDEYSSRLNQEIGESYKPKDTDLKHRIYTLKIKPDDFFMFGSGFGDIDADMTPVYEQVIDYDNGKLSDKQVLIPASSVKGAISHRTAFYYNKAKSVFTDKITNYSDHLGENNEAVKAIFGHKKELTKHEKTELGEKGKILISDCFKEDKEQTKTFDHVSIDRFTGGAIDGALFQEKTIASDNKDYEIEILLEKSVGGDELQAFEDALSDICNGMLPLGGATTKGHGVFSGTWSKS